MNIEEYYKWAHIFIVLSFFLFRGVKRTSLRGKKSIGMHSLLRLAQFTLVFSILVPAIGRILPPSPVTPDISFFPKTTEVWDRDVGDSLTHANGRNNKFGELPSEREYKNFLSQLHIKLSQMSVWWLLLGISLSVGIGKMLMGFVQLRRFVADCTQLKKIKRVYLLSSENCSIPMATRGLRALYIVVPDTIITSRENLRLSIKHELEHHRQGDTIWIFFAEFLRALFFINPCIHLWIREIGELQELSCDESLVLKRTVSPHDYGLCLLYVAENLVPTKTRTLFGTAGMSQGGSEPKSLLRRRIEMLRSHSRTNSKWKIGFLVLSTSTALLATVSLAPIGHKAENVKVHAAIQTIAEKALLEGVPHTKGQGGFAIVSDVNTGEILATAHVHQTQGQLEPDKSRDFLKELNNPWSISKTFLIAKAIDSGIMNPTDPIDCGMGNYEWNGVIFHDWKPMGNISVTKVLADSSNIGGLKIALKIVERIGPSGLLQIEEFGFGTKSVAGNYPGGGIGTFPTDERKLPADMAVGQDGFRVSPIELVQAFGAMVNGGRLLKPVPYQGVEKKVSGEQVISSGTSNIMRTMLSEVVKTGTGQKGKTASYSTGGKTASAPRLIGDEGPAPYAPISSFVGFSPVKNPRIVVFVGVEKVPESHGSTQAAPIFSQIVEGALRELKVPSDL